MLKIKKALVIIIYLFISFGVLIATLSGLGMILFFGLISLGASSPGDSVFIQVTLAGLIALILIILPQVILIRLLFFIYKHII